MRARGSTGIGGWFTKNAYSIYSSEPPTRGLQHCLLDEELDALPTRELAEGHEGEARIQTYGLAHRDGIAGSQLVV